MKQSTKSPIKTIIRLGLIPVALIALIVLLLYTPFIQNFAVKKATHYASASFGMQINIGHLRLTYPLNLHIQDITVIDSQKDTLLHTNDLTLGVRLRPLLDQNISVHTFTLSNAQFNTKSWIQGMTANGHIGNLQAKADKIHLTTEEALVNHLTLSDTHVNLRIDTTASSAPDTTSTPLKWIINTDNIQLKNTSFDLQIPSDTLQLRTHFNEITLTQGKVDLETTLLSAQQLDISDANIHYHTTTQPAKAGLDPTHLTLSDININLETLLYQAKNAHVTIRQLSFNEQHSGLSVTTVNGRIENNEQQLFIPQLILQTPYSNIEAQATLPWSALDTIPQGNITAQLTASVDRRDIITLIGTLPETIRPFYPDAIWTLAGQIEGNPDKLHLRQLNSTLPGLFTVNAHGTVEKINQDTPSGQLDIQIQTNNEHHLRNTLLKQSNGRLSIPDNLSIRLKTTLANDEYQANIQLTEPSSRATLTARYHPTNQRYAIDIQTDSLSLIHFLPKDSIFRLSAAIKAQGRGSDPFANTTQAQFNASVNQLTYKQHQISGISADGSLKKHQIQTHIDSRYPYFTANMTIDGNITKEKVAGILILDVDTLNLHGLQVSKQPLTNSFQLFSEITSDLNKNHLIDVTLGNWEMKSDNRRFRPKTLTLHANANEDTTYISFHTGDFGIYLKGNADVRTLADKVNIASDDAMKQFKKDSTVSLEQLRPLLPGINLQVSAGKDNPIYNYLQTNNIFFEHFSLQATTSPTNGINANSLLYAFVKDTLKIDSVQLTLSQDSDKLNYTVDIIKNKFRQQEPFKAGIKGDLQYKQINLEAYYLNGKGQTGLHIGARAAKQTEGWNIRLYPENPVIAFLPFRINPDNYITFKNKENISANLRLNGEEYASIWVHSIEEDGKMKQLLTELNQINLNKLTSGFPRLLPSLSGNANLSLQYVPTENTFMIVADANVDDLHYQKRRLGELLASAVYLPLDKNQHQVDMHIFHNQNEVSTLTALYQTNTGNINGTIHLNQLPLVIIDPFLAGTARMNGALQGAVSVQGTTQKPVLNGYVQMDTASVYVTMAGSQLRLDEKKIPIKDSNISFDKYNIYSIGNNPFVIDGTIDLRNPSNGTADLTLTARNMQLLDAQKENESLVYGKLFVDLNSTLKGPLSGLTMRGNLHLLGGTNMSYILRESPLTVRNRMDGLVTFIYFKDTLPRQNRIGNLPRRIPGSTSSLNNGTDMLMTINIDPVVKMKVDLDEEATNRIELQGGGNLSFQYTQQGDMIVNGRYTLSNGILKYDMPVIGNKTLTIQDNSYVEWSGNLMDPTLNLKATERVRTSVSQGGESSRLVTFNTGVEIKQRLENLSLQFTLDAVDDVTLQNQLASMGPDEESKRAVAMLLTGMYISDDPSGMGFNMGSALNTFLANEINDLSGNLLQNVDFSFGMETYDMTGGQRTDYTFRFSKRFYNDRLNMIVGGALSTGEMAAQNNNFINDASLEYRLDRSGYRYAKLFYNRQYESLLEGEIARFGGGFIFRRKMRRLSELFGIWNKQTTVRQETVQENKE